MNKALFLDRDGVINVDKGYVYKIEDFEFIEGIFDVLKFFQKKGYLLIVITNQAGIGRGYYSDEDFHRLNDWMVQEFEKRGIHITKVYYSPSHPDYGIGQYKREDIMRKPNPGMIIRARQEFEIDLTKSVLIGDKESDIKAGVNAGVGLNIFLFGKDFAEITQIKTQADLIISSICNLVLYLNIENI